MKKFIIRAALTVICGPLVLSQVLLAIYSFIKPDYFWMTLAIINTITVVLALDEIWERTDDI